MKRLGQVVAALLARVGAPAFVALEEPKFQRLIFSERNSSTVTTGGGYSGRRRRAPESIAAMMERMARGGKR